MTTEYAKMIEKATEYSREKTADIKAELVDLEKDFANPLRWISRYEYYQNARHEYYAEYISNFAKENGIDLSKCKNWLDEHQAVWDWFEKGEKK